jgi:hypothetical protein
MTHEPAPERAASLSSDERGSLYAEYLVVLATVGAVVALAIGLLAGPLVELFRQAETVTLLPL